MCSKNTLEVVMNSVTDKAKEIFGIKLNSVILYGSYARQDFDNESDIDVMILADIPTDSISDFEKQFSDFALEMDLEKNIVLSLLIQNNQTFERWKNSSVFFQNIINEGVNYVA